MKNTKFVKKALMYNELDCQSAETHVFSCPILGTNVYVYVYVYMYVYIYMYICIYVYVYMYI